jgi:hypothetical protein
MGEKHRESAGSGAVTESFLDFGTGIPEPHLASGVFSTVKSTVSPGENLKSSEAESPVHSL